MCVCVCSGEAGGSELGVWSEGCVCVFRGVGGVGGSEPCVCVSVCLCVNHGAGYGWTVAHYSITGGIPASLRGLIDEKVRETERPTRARPRPLSAGPWPQHPALHPLLLSPCGLGPEAPVQSLCRGLYPIHPQRDGQVGHPRPCHPDERFGSRRPVRQPRDPGPEAGSPPGWGSVCGRCTRSRRCGQSSCW